MRRLQLVFGIAVVLLSSSAVADELVRDGGEFAVNTYTTDNQGFPEVAYDGDGQFAVTWESFGQDGDAFGIFAQRLATNGIAVDGEFQVNTGTVDNQYDPTVDFGPGGEFVVVWSSAGQDGDGFGVFAQRFDAMGQADGIEFQVNTYTTADQSFPDVAVNSSGEFMTVWESAGQDGGFGGVYAQRYDTGGVAQGAEFRINVGTVDDQNDVRVVAQGTDYLVSWESDSFDSSGEAVVMRRYDSLGMPLSGEIQVNTSEASDQEDAELALLPSGAFAVVWESDGQDGSGETIVAQVFDAAGALVGSEMVLNTTTAGDQENPHLTALGTDGFMAVWNSDTAMQGQDIFGRRFDATGQLVGDEFQINTLTADDQDHVVVTGSTGGRALVAWRSFGGHDGDLAGVSGQLFDTALFADGFESGNTTAWSAASP